MVEWNDADVLLGHDFLSGLPWYHGIFEFEALDLDNDDDDDDSTPPFSIERRSSPNMMKRKTWTGGQGPT